jgi:hypothetical protein
MSAVISPRFRALLAGVLTLAALLVGPSSGSANAGEVSLVAFLNNVGIAQNPTSGANFDGGGFAYSSVALLAGGTRGGQTITSDGMTFTWPNRPSGAPDNMTFNGQMFPAVAPVGATRIGFLGASTNGPVTTAVTLHYRFIDAEGNLQETAVEQPVTFSDWTLNAGTRPAHASNRTAISTAFRVSGSYSPELVDTYVFTTSIPIDPSMSLDSIEFPVETDMHLFGMTIL